MGAIFTKSIDYVVKNADVVTRAPLALALIFVLAIAVAFAVVKLLMEAQYAGAIRAKDATIDQLRVQLDGMQERVKVAEEITERTGKPSAIAPQAVIDPDGIYQHGILVGTVQHPTIDESQGNARFGEVRTKGNLNLTKEFSYRSYILKWRASQVTYNGSNPGSGRYQGFRGVDCEIVGRC